MVLELLGGSVVASANDSRASLDKLGLFAINSVPIETLIARGKDIERQKRKRGREELVSALLISILITNDKYSRESLLFSLLSLGVFGVFQDTRRIRSQHLFFSLSNETIKYSYLFPNRPLVDIKDW